MLFVALGLLVLMAMILAKLPFKTACLVGIASLLPAGPFFADKIKGDSFKIKGDSFYQESTCGDVIVRKSTVSGGTGILAGW
jgi:hypothetical protein